MWELNSTITNVTTIYNRDLWEQPISIYPVPTWCDRSIAFFVAPYTSSYTFAAAGDDYVQVRCSLDGCFCL